MGEKPKDTHDSRSLQGGLGRGISKRSEKAKLLSEVSERNTNKELRRVPKSSVVAMRQVLDDQMEEMHGLFVIHAQKLKRLLDAQEQRERLQEYEIQQAREELVNMQSPRKAGRGEAARGPGAAQLEHAKKLLMQRDAACRLAESENFQLREQLAAMHAVGHQSQALLNQTLPALPPPPTDSSPKPPPSTGQELVLHRLERAQTVLETWANKYHPKLKGHIFDDDDSDDDFIDLPGTVHTLKPEVAKEKAAEQTEGEEEEPTDPRAEYLRQSQKQRKKKMLNSKLKALDMKSRMRDAFAEPSYIATEHYKKKGCAQYIARSHWFEHATMFVILLNSVWIGIESTINESALLINADPGIIIVENLLCLAFTIEIVIRFVAFKNKLRALRDFWFLFDFFLAFFMILETWALFIVLSFTKLDIIFFDSSVLRMMRLLRLTRVARIARMLRFLPEVLILVRAIGAATRSVVLTVLLGLMIVYVFAIALTQIAVDTPAGNQYFSTLPQAMFSLIFNGCFANDLVSMARLVYQDDVVVGALFSCFLLTGPLTVMNLLLGILVEVIRVVATAEQEGRVVRNLKEELHWAKEALGTEGETISQEELVMLLQNDQAIDALQDVGVDLIALVKDPNIIFDGEPVIYFQDFLDEILLLRGSNAATVKDLTVMKNQLMQGMPQLLKRKLKLGV